MSEYAPQYTRSERIRLLLKYSIWAGPLVLLTHFAFLPWLRGYAARAHCYDYGPVNGLQLVFYGLFVGLPALITLTLYAVEGPRSIKILRGGQSPLPGEKVFRPTKYRYGGRARIRPVLLMLIMLLLVGLALRGLFWAEEIIAKAPLDRAACAGG